MYRFNTPDSPPPAGTYSISSDNPEELHYLVRLITCGHKVISRRETDSAVIYAELIRLAGGDLSDDPTVAFSLANTMIQALRAARPNSHLPEASGL